SSKSNDAPMTVDLAKTMEKRPKNKPRKGKRNDTTCYWLMSCLNKNDRETVSEVKSIFINACKSAGFKVGGEYEPRHESIVFECNRSKFINRDKSLQQSRMSYEKRIATLGVSEQEKPFIRRGKRSSKPIEGRDGFDTNFDGSPRSTSDAKHAIAAKPAAASLQVARLSTLVVPGQNEEEDLDFDNGGGFDNDEDWTGNLKHNSYNDGINFLERSVAPT
ncbi:hypothetical protein THAOC_33464, partial [Thalassiosira oceanica]